MFSYYGSKSKIVDLYPSPKYDKIIEPFAGSARYSLKWFDRDVLLVDKYQVIVDVWHYLQQASEKDILGLPDVYEGQSLDSLNIHQEARRLMGFCLNRGSAQPKRTVKQFSDGWNKNKKAIAQSLYKIRHWKIICGDYKDIPSETATWFIDPPYQCGGEWYVKNNREIDYQHLAAWCKGRNGQAIVCENTKARWLPFYPMRDMSGQRNTTTEAIWSNLPHDFQARQPSLFEIGA